MTGPNNLPLEQRAMQGAAMTPEERKRMWLAISPISEAQFDALQAEQRERQVRVPQPGTVAPDFDLEVVTRQRQPTGERVHLSALREQPVGLVFGSYT